MPPRWMMQREMRFVTFSRAVPLMSLEEILPSRIMKSWLRVGASSGFWIALSQPLWKAERMKRSPPCWCLCLSCRPGDDPFVCHPSVSHNRSHTGAGRARSWQAWR
jgi:hypothetical protein